MEPISNSTSTSSVTKGITYILKCADGSYYVGSTNDMEKRFSRHQKGWAARFTKNNTPTEVVYTEEFPTYEEAFRREHQIKKWSRAKKDALIAGDIDKLIELSKSKQ